MTDQESTVRTFLVHLFGVRRPTVDEIARVLESSGLALVPVEPTDRMLEAAARAPSIPGCQYRAMVRASQEEMGS